MSPILLCTILVTLLAGGPDAAPAAHWPGVMAGPGGPESAPAAGGEPAPSPGPDEFGDGMAAPATPFGWPLTGFPAVVRAFEAPQHRFGPGHRGADLAGESGTPVLAAGAGTVVFAGPVAGRDVVSIDHPGGLRTTYEPVSPSVSAGDVVVRGQPIGTLQDGHPECPATSCLHWGARRGTDYLDPLRLLTLGRVRLLPWADASGAGA
jgi:murein DD-endopeptidase MepM/ murein hydrolase activator NlpD